MMSRFLYENSRIILFRLFLLVSQADNEWSVSKMPYQKEWSHDIEQSLFPKVRN